MRVHQVISKKSFRLSGGTVNLFHKSNLKALLSDAKSLVKLYLLFVIVFI